MKRVTISVTFDCDEATAKMAEELSLDRFPSAYELHHFATRSSAGSLYTSIETKTLFHVWVDADTKPDHLTTEAGNVTRDGYLASYGNANTYTLGEARKKARMFNGKVVEAE